MLWRVRGRLVSWANSSVGTLSNPTPPRHPAIRSVLKCQWYVRVLDSTNFIPGHALHEKCLQRQIGVGTLVSSQEQRVLLVPRLNRGFCSSIFLHRISLVRAPGETRRRVFVALESARVACFLGEQFC